MRIQIRDGVALESGRSGHPGPSLGLRVRTCLHRGAVERLIAEGRDCSSSPELALRARQLTDPRVRRQLAKNLRGAVRRADLTPGAYSRSTVMLDSSAVRFGRAALLDLAEQLELSHHVDPRGVMMVRRLLCDGLSPLYDPRAERTVTEAAREAQGALLVARATTALAA